MISRVKLIPLDANYQTYGPFDNLRRFNMTPSQFVGQWKNGDTIHIPLNGIYYCLTFERIKEEK